MVIIIGSIILLRKRNWFRRITSTIIIRIPVFGDIIKKVHLARMSSSLELLISAKISLVKAISLVRQVSDFYPIEVSLKNVESDLWQGQTLNKSLEKYKIYPGRMIALIKVGEQVNQLDSIFKKLSEQYTEEVEYKTKTIGNLLEPLIIIFLGGVVGFILIAMYLPLFQLSNVMK